MNAAEYLRNAALAAPDRVAVRAPGRTLTYNDLLQRVRRGADVLAEAGVGRGDHVALHLPNGAAVVEATLATLTLEAVVVPLDPGYGPAELDAVYDRIRPAAAVGTGDVLATAMPFLPDDAARFYVGGDGGDGVDHGTESSREWDGAVREAAGEVTIPRTRNDVDAFVLHTSGTTGTPKGAVHGHGNFLAVADAGRLSYRLTPDDAVLAVMPLFHCTGMALLGASLLAGCELVVEPEWEPRRLLELLDEREITVFSGVPTMFTDWLAVADEVAVDADALHTAVVGGADVTANLVERSEALLGCPVLNGFGMTETFAAGVWEDRTDERRPPSVGPAESRLVDVEVVDPETGTEQPPGEPGELLVRGESVMSRYHRAPEATAAAFTEDGWLRTGDWAEVDADGYLFLLGRMDHTVVCGGHNVYPREVERVVEELDGVSEAAVVGVPDDRKGEKPVAFVVRGGGVDFDDGDHGDGGVAAETIQEHCLARLAAYKHPRGVHFVEAFPRNSGGKVDREALADRANRDV